MSGTPSPAAGLAQLHAWDALRRPVWMFDPKALCGVYANAAALRLWGADSLEDLLERDFSGLSPAVRARTARLARSTADGGEVAERWTFYPLGRPVTVQATISSYEVEAGRIVLLFEASFLEVEAEERRAVEALRNTSAMITLLDEAGGVLFSNPAAYAVYGGDALGFGARFLDPGRGQAFLRQALADEAVAEVCEMLTLGGSRWHHLDARRVLDPVSGKAGVLLNELDVTRRIKAEQARVVAELRASMAEARQRFLTETSHELRTPLNAVIGFSQLLRAAGLPPAQREHAVRIEESGQHLLAVVNQMISLPGPNGRMVDRSAAAPPQASQPAAEAAGASLPEARALRVLYADDNAHNRALVVAILAAQGMDCQTADDGAQACDAALAGDWDLILMDIQMPVMDGVQAAEVIRARSAPARPAPILAVTADTLPEQVDAYLRAGMVGCIAKPIDIAALVESVICWSGSDRGETLAA